MNEKPKCGCGNTKDPNGYCDGSHMNPVKEYEKDIMGSILKKLKGIHE